MDMGPEMGTYQMFGRNGRSVGRMFKRPPHVPTHWMPYAMLADAKAAAEAVTRLGGRIVNGPMEVPGGDWIAQGIDLQGAAFAVHSSKPATAQPVAKTAKEATPAKKTKAAQSVKPVKPQTQAKPARKTKSTRQAKPPSAGRRMEARRTARKTKKR